MSTCNNIAEGLAVILQSGISILVHGLGKTGKLFEQEKIKLLRKRHFVANKTKTIWRVLTLIPLTWRIWRAPNNANRL